MNKREKIIVAMAIIALLYGIWNYLFEHKKKNFSLTKVNMESLKRSSLAIANKTNLSNQERVIYALIEKNIHDPFMYFQSKKINRDTQKINPKISFEYKGFVVSGDKRIAIINGRDYCEGDELKERGFRVWTILEDKVIIKGPGKSNFIVVPFVDNIKTN